MGICALISKAQQNQHKVRDLTSLPSAHAQITMKSQEMRWRWWRWGWFTCGDKKMAMKQGVHWTWVFVGLGSRMSPCDGKKFCTSVKGGATENHLITIFQGYFSNLKKRRTNRPGTEGHPYSHSFNLPPPPGMNRTPTRYGRRGDGLDPAPHI